ncbi:MAG: hypothetical protein A2156_03490 [Deltaproteobacteria bacterium RBG_16_48_10]|nr:MAG: hypothetical protein A2156_03490 [Deltaproteobacteria bacterium RBG_16_48_10]
MSKKLMILVVLVLGASMASTAMAQGRPFGQIANDFLVGGQFAGTIVNPEGKGDALIFPYYDVRVVNAKTQTTYFAIINEAMTNTPAGGVAAKLRFREWDKSEEVFDADIWLSKNDVWVGVLTRNPLNGLTTLTSPDNVITSFTGTTFTVQTPLAGGFDFFTTFAPGGAMNTKAPPSGFTAADLTNMGYFEVIGEELTADKASGGKVTRLLQDCPNTLSGYAFVVRIDDGQAQGYNATAIANFSRGLGSLFRGPGDVFPDLLACEDGLGQLEFELSKARVYQGYSIETSIAAKFSMIMTFPTKHFHFTGRPNYLWNDLYPFSGDTANSGEIVHVHIYDRNENPFQPEEGWWSPRITPQIALPWEVNVVGLYQAAGPTLPAIGQRDNLAFTTGGFDSGWVWFDLFASDIASDLQHYAWYDDYDNYNGLFGHLGRGFYRYDGLPVVALGWQEFVNLTVGAGYYGTSSPAFYEVSWWED